MTIQELQILDMIEARADILKMKSKSSTDESAGYCAQLFNALADDIRAGMHRKDVV